jgi:hypothetical protein
MRTQDDILADLWEEFGRGKIIEAAVHAPDEHVDGLTKFPDYIYINPAPAIVETLLHELIHRRWPSWSERRVDRQAGQLLACMNNNDVAKWYRAYQKHKRARKRAVQAE